MAVMAAVDVEAGVIVLAANIVPGLSTGLTTMPRPLIATKESRPE